MHVGYTVHITNFLALRIAALIALFEKSLFFSSDSAPIGLYPLRRKCSMYSRQACVSLDFIVCYSLNITINKATITHAHTVLIARQVKVFTFGL